MFRIMIVSMLLLLIMLIRFARGLFKDNSCKRSVLGVGKGEKLLIEMKEKLN